MITSLLQLVEAATRGYTALLKQRLLHSSFPVNFAKFLRTSYLRNTSGRLRLNLNKD